jgi:hypothetical protein
MIIKNFQIILNYNQLKKVTNILLKTILFF